MLAELLFAKPNRISNPVVDGGLAPASAMNADLDLARERAFCDLAVKGGTGQAGPGEHGLDTDNLFKA